MIRMSQSKADSLTRQEGMAAAMFDMPESTCPYPINDSGGTELRNLWLSGYAEHRGKLLASGRVIDPNRTR